MDKKAEPAPQIPSWEDTQKMLKAAEIPTSIKATVARIDLDLNVAMYGRNLPGNRHVPASAVGRLSRIMTADKFMLNGESIKFAADGTMLDGQTRLLAGQQAGKSFDTVVITGLPPDSFDSLDQGRKRRVADALERHGVAAPVIVAAAIVGIGLLRQRRAPTGAGFGDDADEALDFYEKNRRIDQSVTATATSGKLVKRSGATALHFLFVEKNQAEADQFFSDLGSGANLKANDPVFILRERLIGDARARLERREAINQWNVCGWIILAWNVRRRGEKMRRLPSTPTITATDSRPRLPIIE